MNESKHTARPWEVADCDEDGIYIVATGDAEAKRDHQAICEMLHLVRNSDSRNEAVENANAICKAVNCHDELLEACKQALFETARPGSDPLIKMLKSAIAKAEAVQ